MKILSSIEKECGSTLEDENDENFFFFDDISLFSTDLTADG